MKLKFLDSTTDDLTWMRQYYRKVFPEGATNAKQHYFRTTKMIRENPLIGRASENINGAREFHIARTPFSFLYRITSSQIEIMRVIDNRSNWAKHVLQNE